MSIESAPPTAPAGDMAARTATGLRRPSGAPLPSALRLGLSRASVEVRQFFRSRETVVFTFAFPALLLCLLGAIFRDSPAHPDLDMSKVFSASMIAYGIVSTAFITMGVGLAMDREDGTLKRLRSTPVTATAYILGKVGLVATATVAEVTLLLGVGVVVFDMSLPREPGRWLTFAWLLALSVLACTLLGIAASALVRSARGAGVIMNVPVVALQFLSGIFVHPITMLPEWMIRIASVFPVKWMGQGFRSVFLPDSVTRFEAAGAWEHGRTALVLGAWCLAGLLLSLGTFRWTSRGDG